MLTYLYVGLAGALGVMTRYAFNLWDKVYLGIILSTVIINMIGSLLIGIFWELYSIGKISKDAYVTLAAGFLGGFTTFSGYALNLALYTQNGSKDPIYMFVIYAIAAPSIGMSMVLLGMYLVKSLF